MKPIKITEQELRQFQKVSDDRVGLEAAVVAISKALGDANRARGELFQCVRKKYKLTEDQVFHVCHSEREIREGHPDPCDES